MKLKLRINGKIKLESSLPLHSTSLLIPPYQLIYFNLCILSSIIFILIWLRRLRLDTLILMLNLNTFKSLSRKFNLCNSKYEFIRLIYWQGSVELAREWLSLLSLRGPKIMSLTVNSRLWTTFSSHLDERIFSRLSRSRIFVSRECFRKHVISIFGGGVARRIDTSPRS